MSPDGSTLYVLDVNGHLYESADESQNWTPLIDNEEILGFSVGTNGYMAKIMSSSSLNRLAIKADENSNWEETDGTGLKYISTGPQTDTWFTNSVFKLFKA